MTEKYIFDSTSPAATSRFGERMGERLQPGSIIALIGELGCGKTLLTRGICAGLGVSLRQVNSPTFVLVNEYQGRLPVYHMDLYRLGSIDEGFEIGILDYFTRALSGVMVVEWAEKILSLLPEDHLRVQFQVISARKREMVLEAKGRRFSGWLRELCGQ
ncbi:MAG: tRNA (adenosine(37)-N6)-threonylcarbamoyltransferase complex ATPase subunit type 1 TsaE [Chloroflexi bacterium RBG_16_50_9]|nr:MAG: tRNA (adenosine(37)-N6)-threonylcarbamoyltransferase complex ATPase subunit type 1 TsaE [Chloroflexi bacterium RBG_16_50_9]